MKMTVPRTWVLILMLFVLIGVAMFERARVGFSALLLGWKEVLGREQLVDITTLGIQFGVYDLNREYADSTRFAFEHVFVSWLDDNQAEIEAATQYAAQRERWLLITIEPNAGKSDGKTVDGLFGDIRNGDYDAQIDRVCLDIADQGRPVFIRWGHEMDVVTGRYDWAQHDADGYVGSYRRFVTRCRALVPESWYVWSPISEGPEMYRYWPGGEFVDRVGLPVFAFPERDLDIYGHLRSFSEIFRDKYDRVSIYKKEIMIAEMGVAGDDDFQRRWMANLFSSVDEYPLLTAIVYFNSKDNEGAWEDEYPVPDWRIASGILD